jgi:mRNA interferase MazF
MVIRQGDVFWVGLANGSGSKPGYRHPHVVIQNDLFNQSRINTVTVCALTTNLKRAQAPGNVLLERGEANLAQRSVVNVAQVFTVHKSDLVEKIGSLPRERVSQILQGVRLVIDPRRVGE